MRLGYPKMLGTRPVARHRQEIPFRKVHTITSQCSMLVCTHTYTHDKVERHMHTDTSFALGREVHRKPPWTLHPGPQYCHPACRNHVCAALHGITRHCEHHTRKTITKTLFLQTGDTNFDDSSTPRLEERSRPVPTQRCLTHIVPKQQKQSEWRYHKRKQWKVPAAKYAEPRKRTRNRQPSVPSDHTKNVEYASTVADHAAPPAHTINTCAHIIAKTHTHETS